MKKTKIFIICISVIMLSASTVLAFNIPNPTQEFYVGDFANVISREAREYIINTNLNYEKTNERPQVAVVTTNDLSGSYLEEYGVKLFEEWEIGSRNYDSGVLILLSLDETDRGIRIEVGYGLEGQIPDAKAGRIIDTIMPDLERGDYSEGLLKAFKLVTQSVNDEYGYEDQIIFGNINRVELSGEPEPISPVFIIIVIALIFILIWADHRFLKGLILAMLIRSFLHGQRRGGRRGGGFGGGGSFGGGGRSGGGGASGRF